MRMKRLLAGLAVVMASQAVDVRASTILYTDLASFQANATTSNIDFSGLVNDADFDYFGSTLSIGDVTFSKTEPYALYVFDADYGPTDCCAFANSVAPAALFDGDGGFLPLSAGSDCLGAELRRVP